jgi:hypothetical protein
MAADLSRKIGGQFLDAGGAVYNVKHPAYGAVGDGVADDTAAINRALAKAKVAGGTHGSGGVLYFPPGVYRITQPLDLTLAQVHLRGAGAYRSVLRLDTGGVGLDFTGATFCTVKGFKIDTEGMSTPSTVGVLLARISTGAQSWHVQFEDVVIRMHSDTLANGGNGTVGIYNYASEVFGVKGSYVMGDTGLYVGGSNTFGLTSPYQTIATGAQSMTVVEVDGASNLLGIAGPALMLRGGAVAKIDAHLTSTWNHAGLAAPYDYAIDSAGQWTDLEYAGSVEQFPRVLRQADAPLRGLHLRAYAGFGFDKPQIFLAGTAANIEGGDIEVIPTPDTINDVGYLIDADSAAAHVVQGAVLRVRNQKLRIQNTFATSSIRGNTVLATTPVADVSVSAPDTKGNVILGTDGQGDLNATGGYRQTIDGWYHNDVAASLSAVRIARLESTVALSQLWLPVRAGSITGVVVRSNAACTAGTLTVEVEKNGAATGLTAVLDTVNTIVKSTTQAKDLDVFAPGDTVSVRITTSADWAPTTADIRVAIEVET